MCLCVYYLSVWFYLSLSPSLRLLYPEIKCNVTYFPRVGVKFKAVLSVVYVCSVATYCFVFLKFWGKWCERVSVVTTLFRNVSRALQFQSYDVWTNKFMASVNYHSIQCVFPRAYPRCFALETISKDKIRLEMTKSGNLLVADSFGVHTSFR